MVVRCIRCGVLLASLLCGGALAQEAGGGLTFPGLELPDPVEWLAATHQFVTSNGLNEDVERIGWAILFVGFLVGLSRVAYYASEAEWWAVYGRLLLGVIVLVNISPAQKFTQNTWNTAYAWSSNLTGDTVEDELVEGAQNVESLITPLLIVGGTAQMFATKMASRIAAAGSKGLAEAAKAGAATGTKRSLGFFVRLIMYAFLPIFGLYAALVYLSGLSILLAMLLLPLAGAMVVFPGGLSWWSRWVGMVISSVVTILVLPIMFNIVISLGMIAPMEVLHGRLEGLSAELNGTRGVIVSPYTAIQTFFSDVNGGADPRQAALEVMGFSSGITETLNDIPGLITGWLFALVALVVGMVIGLFMMRNFDRVITGFVGGVASGVLPGIPSGRGGGRGSSPALSSPGPGGGGGGGGGNTTLATSGGGGSGGGGGTGGGSTSLATVSTGGNRSARGGGADDAIIDVESREVGSLPSSSRGALGNGSPRALGSGSSRALGSGD